MYCLPAGRRLGLADSPHTLCTHKPAAVVAAEAVDAAVDDVDAAAVVAVVVAVAVVVVVAAAAAVGAVDVAAAVVADGVGVAAAVVVSADAHYPGLGRECGVWGVGGEMLWSTWGRCGAPCG